MRLRDSERVAQVHTAEGPPPQACAANYHTAELPESAQVQLLASEGGVLLLGVQSSLVLRGTREVS